MYDGSVDPVFYLKLLEEVCSGQNGLCTPPKPTAGNPRPKRLIGALAAVFGGIALTSWNAINSAQISSIHTAQEAITARLRLHDQELEKLQMTFKAMTTWSPLKITYMTNSIASIG